MNRPRLRSLAPRLRPLVPAAVAAALLLAPGPSAHAAGAVATVSPGLTAGEGEAVTGTCPTFSWTPGTAGAHELVVYELDGAGGEPGVVLTLTLPAGASSWSPGRQDCLEPGGRYAWTVRARDVEGAPGGGWAEPALFRVASAPSEDEVARAIEVLRRHAAARDELRLSRPREAGPRAARGRDRSGPEGGSSSIPGLQAAGEPPPRLRQRPAQGHEDSSRGESTGALSGPRGAAPLRPAVAPVLASPSLSLSGDLVLGGGIFNRAGFLFLWEDISNLALGSRALASASSFATGNTALGYQALRSTTGGTWNTAVGARALHRNESAASNTAVGFNALHDNVDGEDNTAVGDLALADNTSGSRNTAIGYLALANNGEGERNVAVGPSAGFAIAEPGRDDNIFIANEGVATDSGKIRIGTQGTQNATFIAGISGAKTGQAGGDVVLIDSQGQLGTSSCGTYVAAAVCPIGNVQGPTCDRVPAGSYCEGDGECGTSNALDNCLEFDWYLRTD